MQRAGIAWLIGLFLLLVASGNLPELGAGHSGGQNLSLRFYGHGITAPEQDRIKIPIDPQVPLDVSGDFTLEFWMKATLAENGSAACQPGNDNWIYGNIIFDRDVFYDGDYGDYGVSLAGGWLAFGVFTATGGGAGICSGTNVADGLWHHIAVTRSSAGPLQLFVDGSLDASGSGPPGDISYRDGRTTSFPNSDPFLVLGAEKHDAGAAFPSYSGFIDEVRVSSVVRYAGSFSPPAGPFTADGDTVALYHLDEGPPGPCTGPILDASGAPGGPSDGACLFGGAPPAGPVYSTDTPWQGAPTAVPTCSTPSEGPTPDTTPGPNAVYLPIAARGLAANCLP